MGEKLQTKLLLLTAKHVFIVLILFSTYQIWEYFEYSQNQEAVIIINKIKVTRQNTNVSQMDIINIFLIILQFLCFVLFGVRYWNLSRRTKMVKLKLKEARNWFLFFVKSYLIVILILLLGHLLGVKEIIPITFVLPVVLSIIFLRAFHFALEKRHQFDNLLVENNTRKNRHDGYVKKLESLIKTKELFREAQLKRSRVAVELGVSENALTGLIKDNFGISFNKLINKYRVDEAKKILLNTNFDHYTIEAVGFEVGFGTRASFYNAFKEYEQMTPNEFRNKK
nr:helix-turn-helix transcriptional regulator [uncultured Allomuricauda sp.]